MAGSCSELLEVSNVLSVNIEWDHIYVLNFLQLLEIAWLQKDSNKTY